MFANENSFQYTLHLSSVGLNILDLLSIIASTLIVRGLPILILRQYCCHVRGCFRSCTYTCQFANTVNDARTRMLACATTSGNCLSGNTGYG